MFPGARIKEWIWRIVWWYRLIGYFVIPIISALMGFRLGSKDYRGFWICLIVLIIAVICHLILKAIQVYNEAVKKHNKWDYY